MDQPGEIAFSQTRDDLECRAVVASSDDEQTIYEIQILRDGEVAWSCLGTGEPEDDWAFGCWIDGPGLPCLFADIDNDGKPEMLATVPKSDLSPTVYRVFGWDEQKLHFKKRSSLVDDGTGEFVWTDCDPDEDAQLKWVDAFEGDLGLIVHQRRATLSRRTLTLVPSRRGFVAAT